MSRATIPGLIVSAPRSGAGKTTVMLGLGLAALADPLPDAVVRYSEIAPYDTEVLEVCLAHLGERPHPTKALLKSGEKFESLSHLKEYGLSASGASPSATSSSASLAQAVR